MDNELFSCSSTREWSTTLHVGFQATEAGANCPCPPEECAYSTSSASAFVSFAVISACGTSQAYIDFPIPRGSTEQEGLEFVTRAFRLSDSSWRTSQARNSEHRVPTCTQVDLEDFS